MADPCPEDTAARLVQIRIIGAGEDVARMVQAIRAVADIHYSEGKLTRSGGTCVYLTTTLRPPGTPPVPFITCPRYWRTSHHPSDVREGYCGACHAWIGTPMVFSDTPYSSSIPRWPSGVAPP